jgi:hypothetical protein
MVCYTSDRYTVPGSGDMRVDLWLGSSGDVARSELIEARSMDRFAA